MNLSRMALGLAAVPPVFIALVSYRFLALGLMPAFPDMGGHIDGTRLAFLVHIVASPVALTLGAIQVMPRLRARWPGLHRWCGRVYGLAVLAGGLGGFALAVNAVGGPVAGTGFALLAVLWLAVTANAVRLAMARDLVRHRVWMVCSYALTFAAVTLRLELPVFFAIGMDYPEASRWVAWLAWVPNLAVAWWLVRRGQGRTVGAQRA